jgi:hypothetical protein
MNVKSSVKIIIKKIQRGFSKYVKIIGAVFRPSQNYLNCCNIVRCLKKKRKNNLEIEFHVEHDTSYKF